MFATRATRSSLAIAVTLLVLVGLVGACGPDGPTLVEGSLPEPTPDPAEDLLDGTSGTTVDTAQGCVADPVGADPGTSVTVDLDADGVDDVVRVHRDDDDRWLIRIERAAGDTIDAPLQVDLGTDVGAGVIRPLGAVDLDGDGSAETFTVVGSAGAAVLVAVHVTVGCALAPILLGGNPVSFPVGTQPGLISGLRCADIDGDASIDTLTGWIGQLAPSTTAGQTTAFDLDAIEYRLEGTDLIQTNTRRLTDVSTGEAATYGVLACGDMQITPPG